MLDRINEWYSAIFTDDHVRWLEQWIVRAAIAGFIAHLLLVAAAKSFPGISPFLDAFDESYLSTIYTPFSFILFYEVFGLILSIPRSFTKSVGIQLQIISLIIIRRIFGDIGHLGDLKTIALDEQWVRFLGYDMIGALSMFFGVIAFSKASEFVPETDEIDNVENFVKLKRSITFMLAILLGLTAITTLTDYVYSATVAIGQGEVIPQNADVVFYKEMFTVMIFTDVAILIASLAYSHRFELVFRNAGFVISTILLRLSLSIHRPVDLLFMGTAFIFAILVLLGYAYYLHEKVGGRLSERQEPEIM